MDFRKRSSPGGHSARTICAIACVFVSSAALVSPEASASTTADDMLGVTWSSVSLRVTARG